MTEKTEPNGKGKQGKEGAGGGGEKNTEKHIEKKGMVSGPKTKPVFAREGEKVDRGEEGPWWFFPTESPEWKKGVNWGVAKMGVPDRGDIMGEKKEKQETRKRGRKNEGGGGRTIEKIVPLSPVIKGGRELLVGEGIPTGNNHSAG